ncbi:hypothetical protein EU523_00175 [Candidatus Heimdallarchaeota archaeon]|nr:MAG: hypothetical protein EU523_00175 [Candidatus Heimdallarchaeota archaeon]
MTKLIRFNNKKIICTGGVVFIGDGQTGKTHTALNLAGINKIEFGESEESPLKKSVNLEFNYFVLQTEFGNTETIISSQLFIMPGQKGKASKGNGLAFEDATDFFLSAATVKEVLALVLTYDLSDLKTFQKLDYWLERAMNRNLIHDYTSIILLGTHLDFRKEIIITEQNINNAISYINSYLIKNGFNFNAKDIHPIKISNKTKEGIPLLKEAICISFLSAFNLYS